MIFYITNFRKFSRMLQQSRKFTETLQKKKQHFQPRIQKEQQRTLILAEPRKTS